MRISAAKKAMRMLMTTILRPTELTSMRTLPGEEDADLAHELVVVAPVKLADTRPPNAVVNEDILRLMVTKLPMSMMSLLEMRKKKSIPRSKLTSPCVMRHQ